MRVLTCLAARPGDLVTRAELMDAAWGDVHVGEDPLNRAIAELRKLFGDRARAPRIIETIPKRGYRLLVTVERLDPTGTSTSSASTSSASTSSTATSSTATSSTAISAGTVTPASQVAGPAASGRRRSRLAWRLAALAATVSVALGGALAGRLWREPKAADPPAPGRVVPLTSFPGREMSPALEPDGQRVTFAWSGLEGGNMDIWITQRGGAPLRLTRDPAIDHQPAWTPDGAEVVFVRSVRPRCEVLAVPAIGGPERRLYSCRGQAVGLDISPEGDELLVADRDPELATAQLVAVDLATGERRFLTRAAAAWSDELPRYAPDGASVVFRRRHGSAGSDLFRVSRAGGDAVRLTHDRKDLGGHAWTADGRGLVVASNRGGGFGLWRFDAAGGPPRRLGYDNAFLPSIGRRGLVFEKRSGDVDLARLELPVGELAGPAGHGPAATATPGIPGAAPSTEPWGVSTRLDFEPTFAPDGRRVALISQRSGSDELWIADAGGTGENAVQLTFFERPTPGWLPAVEHPRFTPDGARVVVAAHLGESYDLYAVPADGGPPRRLTTAATDERAPCVTPDGRWLVFVADRDLGPQIWRLPAGGEAAGEALRLTWHGAAAHLDCPAPGTLFYRRPGGARIRRLLFAGDGTVRADEPVGPPFVGPDWTATAEGLYGFLVDPDGTPSLVGFHLADRRRIHSVALGAARPAGGIVTARGGLAIAPDGDAALYARIVGDESDLLLVDGFR